MVMEMSKTYQYRKVMKPLLERKRRARINKCLDELKDIMVECLTQEGEHVTRLEKADILELTVEHMRKLKKSGILSLSYSQSQSDAHVESFRSGYVHAADQISQVFFKQQCDDEIAEKITKFLSSRLIDMQHHLYRTPSTSIATVNRVQSPTQMSTVNTATAKARIAPITPHLEVSNISCKQFICKDNELIDVISIESPNTEPVWRPW